MNTEAIGGGSRTPADGPFDRRDIPSPLIYLTSLTDEMLPYKSNKGVDWAHFRFKSLDPKHLIAEVQGASYGGLLILDRGAMPLVDEDPTIRLATSNSLIGVRMEAHRFRGPRRGHFQRRLDLIFDYQYSEPKHVTRASQRLSLAGGTQDQGRMELYRVALVDPNSSRAGYDRKDIFEVSDEAAEAFIGQAESLFKAWQEENPERVAAVSASKTGIASKTSGK